MENREEIDALFRYAAEGILITDQEGLIVRINPSAEQLFGYGRDELLHQRIEVLIPDRFTEQHTDVRRRYNTAPRARIMGSGIDLYGRKKDGTELPVAISLSPYSTSRGKFVIAFIVDNTIRKQTEEQLRNYSIALEHQVQSRTAGLQRAVSELEKMKQELHRELDKERDVNELKSRFVSLASHEFRTPLTTILTSLYLISTQGELNEQQQKYASKIKRSIATLTGILDDFLSLSKLEEGQIRHRPIQVNLRNALTEIVGDMCAYGTGGHRLVYRHTGAEEAIIDLKLLQNILFNLLSNAIKFSPEQAEVTITSAVLADEIRISVRDEGIGISEEDQQHLFERFFRGTNATYIQGTGLGLDLVSKYAELMSATVSVESTQGAGTCFTLVLPLRSK